MTPRVNGGTLPFRRRPDRELSFALTLLVEYFDRRPGVARRAGSGASGAIGAVSPIF